MIVFDVLLDGAAPAAAGSGAMPSFATFSEQAPDLAAAVARRLQSRKHHTLATLRGDGAPRLSGTECVLRHGELWIGSMWQARKALDLQRDGRYALHSGSEDPPAWTGDAKVAGVADEVTDPVLIAELNGEAAAGGPSHLFRLDIAEASTVHVDEAAKLLIIEVWTPAGGVRRIERT